MSDRGLGAILNDCIDRLAAGETIEDCLRAYPRHAAALRPMLEAGELVNRARIVGNDAIQAELRVRERLLRELEGPERDSRLSVLPRRQNRPLLRLVAIGLTVFLCLISTGVGGTWLAAQLGLFDDQNGEGQEEIPQTASITFTPTTTPTATATATTTPTATLSPTPTSTLEGDYAPANINPSSGTIQSQNPLPPQPNTTLPLNPANSPNTGHPPPNAVTPGQPANPSNPPVGASLPTLTPRPPNPSFNPTYQTLPPRPPSNQPAGYQTPPPPSVGQPPAIPTFPPLPTIPTIPPLCPPVCG